MSKLHCLPHHLHHQAHYDHQHHHHHHLRLASTILRRTPTPLRPFCEQHIHSKQMRELLVPTIIAQSPYEGRVVTMPPSDTYQVFRRRRRIRHPHLIPHHLLPSHSGSETPDGSRPLQRRHPPPALFLRTKDDDVSLHEAQHTLSQSASSSFHPTTTLPAHAHPAAAASTTLTARAGSKMKHSRRLMRGRWRVLANDETTGSMTLERVPEGDVVIVDRSWLEKRWKIDSQADLSATPKDGLAGFALR